MIQSKKTIQNSLAEWFRLEARDLPWRRTHSAYHIWLSEVILQQTRIDQGTAYYERFIAKWPTVHDLAAATEDEVLLMWQGLGYYSRARNLLKAAGVVHSVYGGEFPHSLKEILRLPGVGPYTGRAILSFAYNLPVATVDGNVYRVLSRLTACDVPIDKPNGVKHFQALADELLDEENSSIHNQAVMEVGALVCLPTNPQCGSCPVVEACEAFAVGRQTDFPVKTPKAKLRDRSLLYIDVFDANGASLLRRRPAGDVWQGLYEPLLIEYTLEDYPTKMFHEDESVRQLLAQLSERYELLRDPLQAKHILSHQRLFASYYAVRLPRALAHPLPERLSDYQIISAKERGALAVPQLIKRFESLMGETSLF